MNLSNENFIVKWKVAGGLYLICSSSMCWPITAAAAVPPNCDHRSWSCTYWCRGCCFCCDGVEYSTMASAASNGWWWWNVCMNDGKKQHLELEFRTGTGESYPFQKSVFNICSYIYACAMFEEIEKTNLCLIQIVRQ